MKHNVDLDSLENKIIISCVSIAAITVAFYLFHNRKYIEGMGMYISEGPFDASGMAAPLVNINSDVNTIMTMEEVAIAAATTDALVEEAKVEEEVLMEEIKVEEMVLAEEIKMEEEALMVTEGKGSRVHTAKEGAGDKIINRANAFVGAATTGIGIAASQAQNTVTNAQNAKTYYRQADWNSKAVGMFSNFWKVGLLGFLVASGVGSWAIKNIEVLIYRVMNFKSCFFWYFLEIIGWILYLPIEFIVWLFCLQEFEKTMWKSLDALDCSIYGFIGFYLFKHSDDVNQKCYSKVFTSFPKLTIPFNFDTIGNYMGNMDNITNQLTTELGSPEEIDANVEKSVQEAEKAAETAKALDTTVVALSSAEAATSLALALATP